MEYQDCTVTVGLGKNPDGTAKEVSRTYKQVVKSSVKNDDILALLSDEKTAAQLISDWHYGSDLRAKATVRAAILEVEAAPEATFEKEVKSFMKARAANGKPVTEEQARKVVRAMLDSEVS